MVLITHWIATPLILLCLIGTIMCWIVVIWRARSTARWWRIFGFSTLVLFAFFGAYYTVEFPVDLFHVHSSDSGHVSEKYLWSGKQNMEYWCTGAGTLRVQFSDTGSYLKSDQLSYRYTAVPRELVTEMQEASAPIRFYRCKIKGRYGEVRGAAAPD